MAYLIYPDCLPRILLSCQASSNLKLTFRNLSIKVDDPCAVWQPPVICLKKMIKWQLRENSCSWKFFPIVLYILSSILCGDFVGGEMDWWWGERIPYPLTLKESPLFHLLSWCHRHNIVRPLHLVSYYNQQKQQFLLINYCE